MGTPRYLLEVLDVHMGVDLRASQARVPREETGLVAAMLRSPVWPQRAELLPA
jgi:hypothetical protein